MKIHIVLVQEVYDFETFPTVILPFFDLKQARKRFDEEVAAAKANEDYEDWTQEESKNTFEIYDNARYCGNHTTISLQSCTISPSKPFCLDVIFGEEACNYIDEGGHSFAATRKKIASGDLCGDLQSYHFDTKQDAIVAEKMLLDNDGWLNNNWQLHRNKA